MYENSKSLITITEELFSEFQQIKTNNYNYSRILSKTEELETYIVHKKMDISTIERTRFFIH